MFKNRDGQIRSGWKIAASLGSFFGISLIAELLVVTILLLLSPLHGRTLNAVSASLDAHLENWAWLLNTVQTLVMLAVAVFAWKVIMKRRMAEMGLGRLSAHKKELGTGLLLGALSMTLVFVLLVVFGCIKVDTWAPRVSSDTFVYLPIFILVGVCEEVFSRGYTMSILRQTHSPALVVIVSSAVFSLLHIFNPGYSVMAFINLFLIGALFAYMFMKTGSIWMPIGYHITWNYFQGCVFGMNTSGLGINGLITIRNVKTGVLSSGIFGPEESLLTTLVIVLGFALTALTGKRQAKDFFEQKKSA